MISTQNVSMRFGSKLLFDDVTTTFSSGRRYGLTGPNGAGKSTFLKLLTGELPPQKGTVTRPAKLGVLRQDQFVFDRVPRDRHGDHGQRPALGGAPGARAAVREDLDQPRGRHAPWRARGHRRRGGRIHGGERRGHSPAGARHSRPRCTTGRWRSCRVDRRSGFCSLRRCSDIRRRCCSTSRRTTSTSTRSIGCASTSSATRARSS